MMNELKYAKILESTGLEPENAEKQLKVIGGIMSDNAATKEEFGVFKSEMKNEFGVFKSEMKNEFRSFKDEVKQEFVKIDKKFVNIDNRFAHVDMRFESIEQRFKLVDQRFEWMNEKFESNLRSEVKLLMSNMEKMQNAIILKLGALMIILFGLAATFDKWGKLFF